MPNFSQSTAAARATTTDAGEDRNAAEPVLPFPVHYYEAHTFSRHSHFRAQLLYAQAGVLEVVTDHGAWTLPPQQAAWIPPGIEHEVHCPTAVEMRFLYVHPAACAGLPTTCVIIAVTPLLRELVVRASEQVPPLDARDARLGQVLLDELACYTPAPLHLPLPAEARIARVTEALRRDPADSRSLGEWAALAGTSERTLARLFEHELGMRFSDWRQRLRLQQAVTRLASGDSVTEVALDLGYQGPSAFIAMFKRAMGTTPARYLES